jgi:hypothetical protein
MTSDMLGKVSLPYEDTVGATPETLLELLHRDSLQRMKMREGFKAAIFIGRSPRRRSDRLTLLTFVSRCLELETTKTLLNGSITVKSLLPKVGRPSDSPWHV